MKANTHPNWHNDTKVICSCGNTFVTGSSLSGEIKVDICSECHPFFTGEMKFVDVQGRVEKFQAKQKQAQQAKQKSSKKKSDTAEKVQTEAKSLKQILSEARKEVAKDEKSSASKAPKKSKQ